MSLNMFTFEQYMENNPTLMSLEAGFTVNCLKFKGRIKSVLEAVKELLPHVRAGLCPILRKLHGLGKHLLAELLRLLQLQLSSRRHSLDRRACAAGTERVCKW